MDRFNIPLAAEGLTAYAIEWQNGFERSSPSAYTPTWAETRRLWTDAILQGMARLESREPDSALMELFDRQLEQARGSFATVPASPRLQKETIRSLRNFVRALESAGDDHRRQIAMVGDLLEDMVVHLPWQCRILWRRIDTILRGGSHAQLEIEAAEKTADALPPPEPAAPPLILDLRATSTGQLTLF